MQTVGNGRLLHGPYRPIGEWNVAHVTSMRFVLHQDSVFNGDLSKCNVGKFMCMRNMVPNLFQLICSVVPNLLIRTCPKATWHQSPTWIRCSVDRHLSSYCVVILVCGSILNRSCLRTHHPGKYRLHGSQDQLYCCRFLSRS